MTTIAQGAQSALIEDHAPRSNRLYLNTCDLVWKALCFYRMRNRSLWRTLRLLHCMAPDFAITQAQADYILAQTKCELGI